MAEVRSTGIQFHATPSEIVNVLAQFRAKVACNVAVARTSIEDVTLYNRDEVIDWLNISELARDASRGVRVYLSESKLTCPSSSRYFLDFNMGSTIVNIGKMTDSSLQETSISCKSENPDDLEFTKKAINLFRKITKTGAYAFKPGEDGELFYKNHRYSQGAKDLYDKGYEIKPIAGSIRHRLP